MTERLAPAEQAILALAAELLDRLAVHDQEGADRRARESAHIPVDKGQEGS